MTSLAAFNELVERTLIPQFCEDTGRGLSPSGFVALPDRIEEADARDFVRAWEAGLARHQGRGQYLIGCGTVREQFFWTGRAVGGPRSFTLWAEPVITLGAIGRLHFDYQWPLHRIAAQSPDWAFDIVTYTKAGSDFCVAGEVKKTTKEVDELAQMMSEFGANPDASLPTKGKEINAFRKAASLRQKRADLLWLVGPGGHEHIFKIEYTEQGCFSLAFRSTTALSCAS